ncbi:MAG TPA: class I SAM-dependent methyltransferase [Acidobacteriaceae bacterium]|nr:class I SAM-dependent methyltransferase [Acidobacteriaceae bacterium]
MPPTSQPAKPRANFDRIARPYRWLEYLSFGPMLERCRFCRIPQLKSARRALVLGDGDGRFLARLLTANPSLHADVVDQSPAMLRLLESRTASVHTSERIRIHHADALTFAPSGVYDLIVTHFFLDCFTTSEVQSLAQNIRPHLAPGAIWLVSEFAIPSGFAALPARTIVSALYAAFHLITGLRTRALPNHSTALVRTGFTLLDRRTFLFGLLISELWQPS